MACTSAAIQYVGFLEKNYDLTVTLARPWTIGDHMNCYAGIGAELMLRINGDDRSQASSGVMPVIIGGVHYYKQKFYFNLPLWLRFYANGYSATLLPEPSYKISERFQLFLRYELSFLAWYSGESHEWRHDNSIGCYYYF